jgi:hypothetical protein
MRALLACVLATMIVACSQAPPPTANDLVYPVLVLFEESGAMRHDDAGDLRIMSVR